MPCDQSDWVSRVGSDEEAEWEEEDEDPGGRDIWSSLSTAS